MTIDIPAPLEKEIELACANSGLGAKQYVLDALIRAVVQDYKKHGLGKQDRLVELFQLVDLLDFPDESETDEEFEAFVESKRSKPQPVVAPVMA